MFAHQQLEGFRLSAVAANQAVAAQLPNVAGFAERRILQFECDVEFVVLNCILYGILKEVVDFSGVKAGQGNIEFGTLQVSDQQS